MKKSLLSFFMLTLCICLMTFKTFAQAAPGTYGGDAGTVDAGSIVASTSADPSTLPKCSNLFSFKRNNGNGWGVCGGQAQITVSTSMLSSFPDLVQIHDGAKNYLKSKSIANSEVRGNVTYCLPENNIPPASKITLVFATWYGGCTVSE